MSQEAYQEFVRSRITLGEPRGRIADGLRSTFPDAGIDERAAALHFLVTEYGARSSSSEIKSASSDQRGFSGSAPDPGDQRVENAAFLASELRVSFPSLSPLDIMHKVLLYYPDLTATEIAKVLRHGPPSSVFPNLTCSQMAANLMVLSKGINAEGMRAALAAAGYAKADIDASIEDLFAPQGLTVDKVGPAQYQFRWKPMQGVLQYRIQILDAQGSPVSPQPRIGYGQATAQLDVSAQPMAPGNYQARVQPSPNGPFSKPVPFTVFASGATLIHHWTFSEQGGPTARDSAGSVNGTLSQASRTGGGPRNMPAVHIEASDQSFVNFTSAVGQFGTRDFSVALWLRTSEFLRYFDIIGNRTASSSGNFFSLRMTGWHERQPPGQLTAEIDDNGRNYVALESTRTRLNDGQWHHVAVVRFDRELRLFVDGVRNRVGGSITPTNIANGNNFKLGRSMAGVPEPFTPDAYYADIRIYDGALRDEEVAKLFSGA